MKSIRYMIDEDGDLVIRQEISDSLRYEVWCFLNEECVVEYRKNKDGSMISNHDLPESDFPSLITVA